MIGQKNLLKKLNSFTMNSLPHSILLLGEDGSEQDEICDFICDKFSLYKYDMNETFSKELIDTVNTTLSPTLCVLDLSQMDERKQNILLKLFEEPNQYVYIVLLCQNDSLALETIKTRSYIIKLDTYTKQDLLCLVRDMSLEDTQLVLDICHTPGQVELANHCNIRELYNECVRLQESLPNMLAYEVLNYSDKINFSDNYDKYDLSLFTKMLKYVIIDLYKEYRDVIEFEKYVSYMVKIGKMDGKQCYFDNFMLKLWRDSKDGH